MSDTKVELVSDVGVCSLASPLDVVSRIFPETSLMDMRNMRHPIKAPPFPPSPDAYRKKRP